MTKWLNGLVTDAIIFGCFYLWRFQGIHAAQTFVTFIMWTLAALLWIGVLFGESGTRKRITPYTLYAFASTAVTVCLMVWSDMPACAITFFLAWVFSQARIKTTTEAAK